MPAAVEPKAVPLEPKIMPPGLGAEPVPVPPLATGTVPVRLMVGVAPEVAERGALALTLVTLPVLVERGPDQAEPV